MRIIKKFDREKPFLCLWIFSIFKEKKALIFFRYFLIFKQSDRFFSEVKRHAYKDYLPLNKLLINLNIATLYCKQKKSPLFTIKRTRESFSTSTEVVVLYLLFIHNSKLLLDQVEKLSRLDTNQRITR